MKARSRVHVQFGRRVKTLRHAQGITQEKLAEAIGVDRSYMGFVERGERNPTLDKVAKIARALKVPIFELFV